MARAALDFEKEERDAFVLRQPVDQLRQKSCILLAVKLIERASIRPEDPFLDRNPLVPKKLFGPEQAAMVADFSAHDLKEPTGLVLAIETAKRTMSYQENLLDDVLAISVARTEHPHPRETSLSLRS